MVARTSAMLIVALAAVARSQTSEGELRAFAALRGSHIGALSPIMTPAMLGRSLGSAQLAARYALRDEAGVFTQAVAGTALFGLGLQSSLAITAGVADADCPGCAPALMLGLGGDIRVYQGAEVMGPGTGLTVAVSGDLGFAQLEPDEGFVIGVGAPITLSLGSGGKEGMRIVPYFTPVFGIGQTNAPCGGPMTCDQSGTRWVLGGGIGVWNPISNVSASLGINHVVAEGAKPVYGVNIAIGGR